MAGFKIKYPGYAADLENLIMGLGQIDRINAFREYMSHKAQDRSNPEKAQAAHDLKKYFDRILSVSSGAASKLQKTLPNLERIANKEEPSDREMELLETGSELEEQFFDAIKDLHGIKDAMTRYNNADGYNELNAGESMQDMFQAVEGIDGLLTQKSIMDVKADRLDINLKVSGLVNRSEQMDNELKSMVDKNIDLDPDHIEREYRNIQKVIDDKTKEEKYLTADNTRKEYEKTFLENAKKLAMLKEQQKELELESYENKAAIKEEEEAAEQLSEDKEEESRMMEERSKLLKRTPAEEKTLVQAQKTHRQAKQDYESADDSLSVLRQTNGENESVNAYYEKRMTYERLKKTYDGFKSFLDSHTMPGGNFDNNVVALFAPGGDKLEKVFAKNENQRQQLQNAKIQMGVILEMCPDKKMFGRAADANIKAYTAGILNKLNESINHAKSEYEIDDSYVMTQMIQGLVEQRSAIDSGNIKEEEKEAALNMLDNQMEICLQERSAKKLANSNDIDAVIRAKLEGKVKMNEARLTEEAAQRALDDTKGLIVIYDESLQKLRSESYEKYSLSMKELRKQKKEGRLSQKQYDELARKNKEKMGEVSITDLLNEVNTDLEKRKLAEEKYFIEKSRELLTDIYYANNEMVDHSPNSLEKQIKTTKEELHKAKGKFNDLKNIKNDMNRIYNEYQQITKEQNEVYANYSKSRDNEKMITPIHEKADAYMKGFHNALKSKNHKNSNEYKAINEALKSLHDLDKTASAVDIRRSMEQLKKASADYIKAKKAEWRPFPSNQRTYRLNYAESIEKFCDSQLSLMKADSFGTSPKVASYMKTVDKMHKAGKNKAMDKNEFFNVSQKRIKQKNGIEHGTIRRTVTKAPVAAGVSHDVL